MFPLDGWPPLPVYWPQLQTVLAVHEMTNRVFCITILRVILRLKSRPYGRIRIGTARVTVNCSAVRMITIAEPWQDLGIWHGYKKYCKFSYTAEKILKLNSNWIKGLYIVTRNVPGAKDGRRVRLMTSPHLWADCPQNVRASTSHNPLRLRGLLQG
jgi:hypothetical protein